METHNFTLDLDDTYIIYNDEAKGIKYYLKPYSRFINMLYCSPTFPIHMTIFDSNGKEEQLLSSNSHPLFVLESYIISHDCVRVFELRSDVRHQVHI